MAYGTLNVDSTVTSWNDTTGGLYGFKNRIINGAMMIDQRNAGASVSTASGTSVYATDRWKMSYSQTSKFTAQQSSTAPAGFANSLLITSSSSYSVGAGDYFAALQAIEGFNTADLAFGTASASTFTLSFWVRSSLTGTFGGSLTNAAFSRSYPFTYTISSANTWEQKTITVAGDTTGTWIGASNSAGLNVLFGLGVGSTYSGTAGSWAGTNYNSATGATSIVGTNGATWYITGVQLEKGSTATSFDYRPYGTELSLCQRYCFVESSGSGAYKWFTSGGYVAATTYAYFAKSLPVTMRTSPSMTVSSATGFLADCQNSPQTTTAVTDTGSATTNTVRITATVANGLTAGQSVQLANDASGISRSITYSAEL